MNNYSLFGAFFVIFFTAVFALSFFIVALAAGFLATADAFVISFLTVGLVSTFLASTVFFCCRFFKIYRFYSYNC